ncbi:MAG: hypothetical protein ACJAZ3_000810 [Sphingobacteriales bacterium]|jgi:hypothetical protein
MESLRDLVLKCGLLEELKWGVSLLHQQWQKHSANSWL